MSLKLKKRRNTLENSRGTNRLELDTLTAWSYNWWQFTQLMPDGTVLFNNYSYSSMTSKHQGHVSRFLYNNAIGTRSVSWGAGLQVPEREIENKAYKIKKLQNEMAKPRTHKAKNQERAADIIYIEEEIKFINEYINLRDSGQLNNKFTGQLNFDCLKPKPKTQYHYKTDKELFNEEIEELI